MQAEPDPVTYRDEVLAIIGAMADLLIEVRGIKRLLDQEDDEEEEED